MQASPDSSSANASSYRSSGSSGGDQRAKVDDAVLEQPARRVPGLPDLAAVDRGHGEVLEDERLGDVDRRGPPRNPEEDDVASVPHDPEGILDRAESAGHLEDDADPDALVLLEEPRRDVVHLVHVHDVVRAERPRELHAERDVVGGEEPSGAEGLRDRDREEADRPAAEHGDARPARSWVDVAKTALPNGSCRHAISGGSFERSFRQTTLAGTAT